MLLTTSILSKASFIGSLLNRCRPSPAAIIASFSPSAGIKTLEEQVGLPPRPKKPMTPYFRFMRDIRFKMQAEHPALNTRDLVREISKKWLSLDSNVKQRLQDEFKKEQEVYVEERAKYDAKLTEEQRAEIKKLKQAKAESKERRMMRKRLKLLGRPKKPASAFFRYMKNKRIDVPNANLEAYHKWYKKCAEMWTNLPEEQKEIYFQEARKENEKYKMDLLVWEEKMMRSGNIDVVRHNQLIDLPESKSKRV